MNDWQKYPPSAVDPNRVQQLIEQRARDELEHYAPAFADWIGEHITLEELGRALALSIAVRERSVYCAEYEHWARWLDRMCEDYTQYRVALAQDNGEWDRIATELYSCASVDPEDA